MQHGHAAKAPAPGHTGRRRDISARAGILPGTAAANQLADECGVPVPGEASHIPAKDKITINFGSPFGSLTIISSSERQWAQQGSNLRPLACKARTYRRWTWLDVARCGICQPRPWLDVA